MTAPLKVGLNVAFVRPDCLAQVAVAAEAFGYESLWLGEHVALPAEGDWWAGYPSKPSSEADMTFRPDNLWLDPLMVFGHLSAITERIRFGVGIYILALRNPVIVGRTIATLDVLSRGRLDLGVGIGWSRDEFRICGVDFRERGRRTDEAIGCLRALFDPERNSPGFEGEFFDFPPIGFLPKPNQSPLPIHIGGVSDAAARRAGKLGNGYYGPATYYPAVSKALEEQGRCEAAFEFTSSIHTEADTTLATLESMALQGSHRAVVQPWQHHVPMGLEVIDKAERFAREIGLI